MVGGVYCGERLVEMGEGEETHGVQAGKGGGGGGGLEKR